MPGQLHGRHPHPSGGGMHQHPLAGLEAGQHRQPVQRGQEHHRHAGGLCQRPSRRHRGHQPRHPPPPQNPTTPTNPNTAIANGKPCHAGPDLEHHARALGAELSAARIHPQRHQHIPEVHPDRGHRHPHLPGGQLHRPGRGDHHVLQGAAAARGQPPSARLGNSNTAPRPHRAQPSRMRDAGAHHQLRLTTSDDLGNIQRSIRIDQHHPAGLLGLRRAHQTPHRRTRQDP